MAWHVVFMGLWGGPCGVHSIRQIYKALGLDVCGFFTAFVAFMGHWRCTSGTWVLFFHALHK